MSHLPAMQPVSLFKVNLEKKGNPKNKEGIEKTLLGIVQLYNKELEEEDKFQQYAIEPARWNTLATQGFSIQWHVSVRHVKQSGVAKTLVSLTGKNDLRLGTVTEHHLIFLYKVYKLTNTAKKTDEVAQAVFALTTDQANHVIRDCVDYSFPLQIARRVCQPVFLTKHKMNLSGSALATNDTFKHQNSFRYSMLESLSELIKGFSAPLKETSSLYSTQAFKVFVKQDENGKPKNAPTTLEVSEMCLKLHHGFTLIEHMEICQQLLLIQDFPKHAKVDGEDPAFEYLDHIRKVPENDQKLISHLNTLLLEKVFEVHQEEKEHTLEFYHHHYKDYFNSSSFSIREKRKKNPLRRWFSPPTAMDVIYILKKQIQTKDKPTFYARLKELVFDFVKNGKKHTFPLVHFFKGEIIHDEKAYFYLDGKWCLVEGEFYSFVQNEFLSEMRTVFLSKKTIGSLPLPWVNNEGWFCFKLSQLHSLYKGKQKWEDVENPLKKETFCYLDQKNCPLFPLDDSFFSEHSLKEKKELLLKVFHDNQKKPLSTDLLKQAGYDKSEAAKIMQALKQPHSFVVTANLKELKVFLRQDPQHMSEGLKKELGDILLKELSHYWKRVTHYRHEEEGYNRNYLYSHYQPTKQPFAKTEGFLVFDQVYASEEKKIELFDVAYYTSKETYLYHVKAGFGQKTRDACSQIRTAAAAIHNARKIGGHSDVFGEIFDTVTEDNPTSPFRQQMKDQLLAFGKDASEAKKHFKRLFKNNNLVFVYAFLDTATSERDLGQELTKAYQFTATTFEKDDCTLYYNRKVFTGEAIFTQLKQEGFLDPQGRLSDKFISIKKEADFKFKFLKEKEKNRKAVYHLLCSALSQFQSFIAKKELLDTKKDIEGMGFGFRICQIYRDEQGVSAPFLPSSPLGIPSSPASSQNYEFEDLFDLDDTIYEKKKTVGDGACSLHALLGKDTPQGYLFCGDEKDPQLAAKTDFLTKLKEKLDLNDPRVKEKVTKLFESFLIEALQKNCPYEAKMLFSHFSLEEWKKEKQHLSDTLTLKKKERNESVWNAIKSLSINDENLKRYCTILKTYKSSEWSSLKRKELLQAIELLSPHDVLNGCWDALYQALDENGKAACIHYDEILLLEQKIKKWELKKISQHFEAIFKAYEMECPSSSFFLSDQELEIAAYLYGKKVKLVACDNQGNYQTEHAQPYNCTKEEEADVVIVNEKYPVHHYSRSEKVKI